MVQGEASPARAWTAAEPLVSRYNEKGRVVGELEVPPAAAGFGLDERVRVPAASLNVLPQALGDGLPLLLSQLAVVADERSQTHHLVGRPARRRASDEFAASNVGIPRLLRHPAALRRHDNDEKKSNSKRQKRKGISPLKPVKIEDEGMGISI